MIMPQRLDRNIDGPVRMSFVKLLRGPYIDNYSSVADQLGVINTGSDSK